MNLSKRQQAFVESYAKGNTVKQAAIDAGYSAQYADKCGPAILGSARIRAALADLNAKTNRPSIATIIERREWWTKVMRDGETTLKERLRASELLGKSFGDFIERHEFNFDWSSVPADRLAAIRNGLAATFGTARLNGHRNGTHAPAANGLPH